MYFVSMATWSLNGSKRLHMSPSDVTAEFTLYMLLMTLIQLDSAFAVNATVIRMTYLVLSAVFVWFCGL